MGLSIDLVRRIGYLRKLSQIPDTDYYALLSGYDVDSCKKLQAGDALKVIAFLQRLVDGRNGGGRYVLPYSDLPYRPGMATSVQLRMLEGLWKDVSFQKSSGARKDAYLKFICNRFHRTLPEHITQEDVGKIKLTLERMRNAKREKEST